MKWYSLAWRGFLVGTADVIPGVSGGTIALLTGIYERFIDAINSLTNIPKDILGVLRGKTSMVDIFSDLDYRFLVPFFTAILVAIAVVSTLLPPVIAAYPALTYSLFIGLILSASYSLLQSELTGMKTTIGLLAGLSIGISLQLVIGSQISVTPLNFLIVGAVALSAMLLPGISGSAILLVLGMYEPVLQAVNQLELQILIWFGLGAILGVSISARIISRFLHKNRALTLSVLTGLMIGSLYRPTLLVLEYTITIFTALALVIGLGLGALLLRSHTPLLSEQ